MSAPKFCDQNCNQCAVIHNRQFGLLANTFVEIYGEFAAQIIQEICPNFTCCPDCHIDDFCHVCDDDGFISCEISNAARALKVKYTRLLKPEPEGGAK